MTGILSGKPLFYAQPRITLYKIKILKEIQTDSNLIQVRRPHLVLVNKEMKICQIMDFAVLADNKVKLKENEKN